MSITIVRKILVWSVAILFSTILLLAVGLNFVDWNQYRETLSNLVSDQVGMRVDVSGRITAGLLPRPHVVTEGVRLFPATDFGAPQVATADKVEIRLGLSALLKGNLAIQHLGFDGVGVILDEAEDGSWQVRGWPEDQSPAEEPSSISPASPTSAVQLDRLEVIGGQVTLVHQNGVERVLEALSLELSGSLPSGPLEWSGGFSLAGEQLATKGRLRPGADGDALSVKTELVIAAGELDFSGRIENGAVAGRLQGKGEDLQRFASALATVANNQPTAAPVPGLPFAVDVQIDQDGGIQKISTRTLMVGASRGRLDLAVANRDGRYHVAGAASLGIIDAAPWLAVESPDQKEAAGGAASGLDEPSSFPVSGSLDVAIEGIEIRDGLIQQVDAVLALDPKGPRLTRLQALLPGGSTFSMEGALGADGGEAGVRLVAGNLPELMRWGGIDVSRRIPPGRLATGEISGDFSLSSSSWAFRSMKARVDTSNLTGEVFSQEDGLLPGRILLAADTINLDAYIAPGEGAESSGTDSLFDGLPESAIEFGLTAGSVQWSGIQYTSLVMEGDMGRSGVDVSRFAAKNGAGTLVAQAKATPHASGMAIESEVVLTNWPFAEVRGLPDEMQGYYRALGLRSLSGKITANGPLETLLITSSLNSGRNRSANLTGTIGANGMTLDALDLQGRLQHDNVGPLFSKFGMSPMGAVPVAISVSVKQEGSDPQLIEVSGEVAGGQLSADGTVDAAASSVEFTFDHPMSGRLLENLGISGSVPNPAQQLRAQGFLRSQGDDISVEKLDIRNGDARLTGAFGLTADKKISGDLKVAGMSYAPSFGSSAAPRRSAGTSNDEVALAPEMFDYSGDISLAFEAMTIAGQSFSAPQARLTAGDRSLRFDLGPNATLNNEASSLSFELQGGASPRIKGKASINAIDLASMLLSSGFRSVFSGLVHVDVDFEGSGRSVSELARSLKGRFSLDGTAGSMNFLAVPQLVQSMNSATSSRAFLGNIGGFLRGGRTDFATLSASATLDSGTALIEKLEAGGPWGALTLDGQINLLSNLMNIQGQLTLTTPPDTPAIPVNYSGALDNPTSSWTSRALERFVIAGIERRLRSSLLKDLGKTGAEGKADNPGAAVFSRAFGLLGALQRKQEQQKKAKEAQEDAAGDKPTSQ